MTEEDLWDGYWVGSEVHRVVETARAGILGVATRPETALEEAVAAYWTNHNPDETEFFIEVMIRRGPGTPIISPVAGRPAWAIATDFTQLCVTPLTLRDRP